MNKRFVEIKGIGIPNKGAELMLIAVMENIGRLYPNHYFCVEPTTEYFSRARYGLFQRTSFPFRKRHVEWSGFARLLPTRISDRYGLVTEGQVDVIVDASGFAYGDQWGAEKARIRLGKNIRRWKQQGKKVVLLPQAFGPFKGVALQKEMKIIVNQADLVFARDKKSLDYLDSLIPGKVVLSPDFTNLVESPVVPDVYGIYDGRPCLIPNHKMITMVEGNNAYASVMAECLKVMQNSGQSPFILIHEGEDDIELGKKIASLVDFPVDVVIPDDALLIKAIIGQCSFVVSSRFHGLVSALSQGVPVVATGWSHKYQELLDDYQMGDFVINDRSDAGLVVSKVKELLNAERRAEFSAVIYKNSVREKEKTKNMWAQVSACLTKGN